MKPALLLCLVASALHAQTFEVASVKPAKPYKGGPIDISVKGGPGTDDPGRIVFSNAAMSVLLISAFGVEYYQLSGPDWLPQDMFDVTVKVPPGATKDQVKIMLRNLLAERFGLAFHREKRDMNAWVLTAGNGGLKQSEPGTKANLTCKKCSMAQFADRLGQPGGKPVFDATGLTGIYDFALSYEPDYGVCKGCDGPPPPAASASVDTPPILRVALRQQLNLKLEQKKMPVDVVVIDRLERTPSEN